MFDISKKKIWVAGHNGMVGSAIVRRLEDEDCKILKVARKELNLLDQHSTESWMKKNKPEIIILAAAKVGGIKYNMLNKSSFLYENLMIQNNVIFLASKLTELPPEKTSNTTLVFLGNLLQIQLAIFSLLPMKLILGSFFEYIIHHTF